MKSAVLVIDLQVGLFENSGVPHDYKATINKINDITRRARDRRLSVIHIQHEQPEGSLQHGSSGWSIVPELQTSSSDIYVRKKTPDSFLGTILSETLSQHGVTDLIVCGYASEFCVDSTVRRAAGLGYSVQLVSDAHTTHDKSHASAEVIRKHHNETLSNIKSFGVPISAVKAEDLIIN